MGNPFWRISKKKPGRKRPTREERPTEEWTMLPEGTAPLGGHHLFAGQIEGIGRIVVRDHRCALERRGLHAGQAIQPVEQPLIELQQPLVLVTALLRLQLEAQEVLLVESQVDSLQVIKRAHEQTRADEE